MFIRENAITLNLKELFNMTKEKYLNDLKDIKQLMNRSSQFLSLSGLSGILAGIYAIIGAVIVYYLIHAHPYPVITLESRTFTFILLTTSGVLLASVLTAVLLSKAKAKRHGDQIWGESSKRMLINFLIPLATGGLFILLLLKHQYYGLIAPVMLIFYGMACVNASKYTLRDLRYLGITEIILGLLATEFPGNSLYFWVVGFGFSHILYGTIMYFKYDRNQPA